MATSCCGLTLHLAWQLGLAKARWGLVSKKPVEDGDRLAAAADFATALCETREDLATAENLYSEVMQVKQRLHGLRHPHTLVSINNLALLTHPGPPRKQLATNHQKIQA